MERSYKMPVQRALRDIGGTIERGFRQRGDIALGQAEMGLRRASVERMIQQDELREQEKQRRLPIEQAQIGTAQEELREQERRGQPANMSYVNQIFGTDRMSPLNILHFTSDVLPALNEASGWTTKEDGNLYRKDDDTLVTQGELEAQMPMMFGIYSTVTDPAKQMEDLAEHMKTDPEAPDVKEVMQNPELQAAMYAKQNPKTDQTPYTNFLIKQYENKINIGQQVSLALEAQGGNTKRIDKQITRYEKKLEKLTEEEPLPKIMEGQEITRTPSGELVAKPIKGFKKEPTEAQRFAKKTKMADIRAAIQTDEATYKAYGSVYNTENKRNEVAYYDTKWLNETKFVKLPKSIINKGITPTDVQEEADRAGVTVEEVLKKWKIIDSFGVKKKLEIIPRAKFNKILQKILIEKKGLGKNFNLDNTQIIFATPERINLNKKIGGGGGLEWWPKEEVGPKEFGHPTQQKTNVIEIYDERLKNNPLLLEQAVIGDLLHGMIKDKKFNQLRVAFIKNFTKETSLFEKKRGGLTASRIDAYIRGYLNPDQNAEFLKAHKKTKRVYSPKQIKILKQMKQYILHGRSLNNARDTFNSRIH